MKIFSCFFGTMFLVVALLQAAPAAALTVGQIDTFEDRHNPGWVDKLLAARVPLSSSSQLIVSTGGPGRDQRQLSPCLPSPAADRTRQLASQFQLAQWSGNYLAAGITAIVMDVKNLGPSDLALRLLVADPTVGPPNNEAFSTDAIVVPTGSDWMRISFPLNPSDLLSLLGMRLPLLPMPLY